MRLSILEGDTYRTGVCPLSVEQQKVFYNNDMYVSDNIYTECLIIVIKMSIINIALIGKVIM